MEEFIQQQNAKLPPFDIVAERNVLASMLLDKSAVDISLEKLIASDFFENKHIEIFSTMVDMENKGIAIDYVTLQSALQEKGKLEISGGLEYLLNLTSSGVLSSNIREYVRIVSQKATLRRLIKISDEIISKSYKQEKPDEILEFAEKNIYSITQQEHEIGLTHIKETMIEAIKDLEIANLNKNKLLGVTTGFVDIDRRFSGLQKGQFVLLAARPSMGKTALAVNMSLAAAKDKKNVAIFSLEMSKKQLVQRMLSQMALIDLKNIINGDIQETSDWEDIFNAAKLLSQINVYIDDTSSISLTELRSKCRRLKSEKGLDLIMIDYLQLMTAQTGRNENRQQEISNISRGLKALAKELDCPILALSQLSRMAERREDKKPVLSDLRESGAIEQDADIVMLLYREDYYKETTERQNIADLIIAKNRNGPTGSVELYFNKEFTKFSDLEKDEDQYADKK